MPAPYDKVCPALRPETTPMLPFRLLRVAAATPQLKVADCPFNAERHVDLLRQAQEESVSLLVFPDLSLTGYTCADLFHHDALLHGALRALHELRQASTAFDGLL